MLNASSPLSSANLIVSPEQMTPEQSKVWSPPNGIINVIDSLELSAQLLEVRGMLLLMMQEQMFKRPHSVLNCLKFLKKWCLQHLIAVFKTLHMI